MVHSRYYSNTSLVVGALVILLGISACGPTEVEFAVKHLSDITGEQLTEIVSYNEEAGLDNSSSEAALQVQIEFQRNYRHQIIENIIDNRISGERVQDKIVELYKLPPNDPEGRRARHYAPYQWLSQPVKKQVSP